MIRVVGRKMKAWEIVRKMSRKQSKKREGEEKVLKPFRKVESAGQLYIIVRRLTT